MIIVDYQTPKRVRFFKEIEKALKETCNSNIEFFRVTRVYGETIEMMKRYRLNYELTFGWKPDLLGKLKVYINKLQSLVKHFGNNYDKIQGVITLADDGLSRFAYGLSIPLIVFDDIPDAIITGKLSITFATKVYVPFYVPVDFLKRNYGISEENIYSYSFLDPIVWLKDYSVSPKERLANFLKIDPDKLWVYIRVEPIFANYYISRNVNDYLSVRIAERIARYFGNDTVVILHPRYNKWNLFVDLEEQYDNIVVIKGIVDSINIVANSDIFIGGGGTINIEAAYYGVPVVSIKPHLTFVERFLIDNNLTYRPCSLEEDKVFRIIIEILSNKIRLPTEKVNLLHEMAYDVEFELKSLARDICNVIIRGGAIV